MVNNGRLFFCKNFIIFSKKINITQQIYGKIAVFIPKAAEVLYLYEKNAIL